MVQVFYKPFEGIRFIDEPLVKTGLSSLHLKKPFLAEVIRAVLGLIALGGLRLSGDCSVS